MGAGRMGFDLFTKQGWKNLGFVMKHRAYKAPIKMVCSDTFKQVVCWVVGHDEYDSGCPPQGHACDLACRRCCHFIGVQDQK